MRYLIIPGTGTTIIEALEPDLTRQGFLKLDLQSAFVFMHGCGCLALDGGRGVVLGKLFDHSFAEVTKLEAAKQHEILNTAGSHLVRSLWGTYIAVLSIDQQTMVVRSPSSDGSCNFAETQFGTIVASDPQLLLALDGRRPSIDFEAIKLHLQAISLRPRRTALTGINEILRGERLTILADGTPSIQALWSPWDFARDAVHRNTPLAVDATAVRDATLGSVSALTRSSSHLLLDLSGGLDSSIVAAALANAGRSFSCLNFRTSQPSGDERDFARSVTERFGVQLHEVELRVSDVDLTRSSAAHLARPTARSFIQAWDVAAARVAEQTSADLSLNGAGGDNVFCSLQSPAPVADRLLAEGFGLGFLKTASHLSAVTGCSLWTALRRGIRRAWRMPATYRWHADNLFLAFPAASILPDASHPWLQVPPSGLPGSAGHIAQLLQIENHLEGFARARDDKMLFPLLAQPLVETCLGIASWKWIDGGVNRRIARLAFQDDLPAALLTRRSKGRPESFLVDVFEAKKAQIRDILGDGILRSERLVDFQAIDDALSQQGPARNLNYTRILRFVDVEAWLQNWSALRAG